MFKDSYKKANDTIKIPNQSRERIKNRLIVAEADRDIKKEKESIINRLFRSNAVLSATFAVLLIVTIGVWIYNPPFMYLDGADSKSADNSGIKRNEQPILDGQEDAIFDTQGREPQSPMPESSNEDVRQPASTGNDKIGVRSYLTYIPYYEVANSIDEIKFDDSIKGENVSAINDDMVVDESGYVYEIKSGGNIGIYSPRDNIKQISSISCKGAKSLLVSKNRLAVISEKRYDKAQIKTQADIFDVSDRRNPQNIGTIEINGKLEASCMNVEFLYVVTRENAKSQNQEDISTYVPSYTDLNGINYVPLEDIYFESKPLTSSVITILSINMEDAVVCDAQAALGYNKVVYSENGRIILSGEGYYKSIRNRLSNKSKLLSLSLNKTIGIIASKSMDGEIKQNSTIEKIGGNLVAVVSDITRTTFVKGVSRLVETTEKLIMFDKNLNIVNSSGNSADKTLIKSTCVVGNIMFIAQETRGDDYYSITAIRYENMKKPKLISRTKFEGSVEEIVRFDNQRFIVMGNNDDGLVRMQMLKLNENEIETDFENTFDDVFYDNKVSKCVVHGKYITFAHAPYFGFYIICADDGFKLEQEIKFEYPSSDNPAKGVWGKDTFFASNSKQMFKVKG